MNCPECLKIRDEKQAELEKEKEHKLTLKERRLLPSVGLLSYGKNGTHCLKCDFYECSYSLCKHTMKEHKNGCCWAITQPEKEGSEKFCKCTSQQGKNLRLYKDLEYMKEETEDMLITKKCPKCKIDRLIRRDEELCFSCRDGSEKKLTEIPSYFIRRPITQKELQRMI